MCYIQNRSGEKLCSSRDVTHLRTDNQVGIVLAAPYLPARSALRIGVWSSGEKSLAERHIGSRAVRDLATSG